MQERPGFFMEYPENTAWAQTGFIAMAFLISLKKNQTNQPTKKNPTKVYLSMFLDPAAK